ncbi:response regulator transcription factor [Paenibacillus sp. GD4]|uniref:response regulator transcription factor n=1 Tax=Paenibacillus sp. GD4 TaxID=3068890 RepID=UPI00279661CD|nr:response regulator transcription factor [Paenibacillus sp. GD4]MDQ1911769.1 response regulator transcription factor [Paenibacillus sp. GD4]
MTTLLLVDDHPMFLAGTQMILEKHGFIVAAAANAAEARQKLEQSRFDAYLYDLNLPEVNGFELTGMTLDRHPDACIVILTGEVLAEHFDRLMELGVSGLLDKSSTGDQLVTGLTLAMEGRVVLPLEFARQLRTKSFSRTNTDDAIRRRLTENERKVLELIAEGGKNKDIAAALFMSQRNVEYLISSIFEKLAVSSRQEAVARATALGYLS